jgi:DNA-directed RNA polymerase specialized sigma54-like protein
MMRTLRTWSLAALLGLGLLLAACGPTGGLSAEEAETLRAQVNEVETRLANIEAIVSEMQNAAEAEREQLADEALLQLEQARAALNTMDTALEPPPLPEADPAGDPLAPTSPGF